jgi:hypothetical protein
MKTETLCDKQWSQVRGDSRVNRPLIGDANSSAGRVYMTNDNSPNCHRVVLARSSCARRLRSRSNVVL